MKQSKKTDPIGIFDSGLGGLTVYKAVKKRLPSENIIYFGDTANVPYGSKNADTIIKYASDIADFLKTQKVKMIIVACNTASAIALGALRKKLDIPVIGVIEDGALCAVNATKKNKVAVLATVTTVRSGAYRRELKKKNKKVSVLEKACPLFVPLIEEGYVNNSVSKEVIKHYLGEVKKSGADAVLLGCTHYPIIKGEIEAFLGHGAEVVDPAGAVAESAARALEKKSLLSPGKGKSKFYASDSPSNFELRAKTLWGIKTGKVNLKKLS